MISEEDLVKYRFNPKLKDKELKELFASNKKEEILNLFHAVNTNEFYTYLIKNNLIIYFETSEIISLLNNSAFIDYLIHTDINIFNNIEDKDYTKELVLMINSNYYMFLNSNFDFAKHPILVNNPNLSDLIIDDLSDPDDFIDVLNNVHDPKTLSKVITKIKEENIQIDIEKLGINAFSNPIIGSYLVFDLNLDNIALLKGEAYKKVYERILDKIKTGDISFEGYTRDTFPEALLTQAVFDNLIFNRKNQEVLKFFPESFHNAQSEYIFSLTADEENRKAIFKANRTNDEFFRIYLSDISEDNSQYLDYFDYNVLSRESIAAMVKTYLNGNRYIRTFFLKLEDKTISNMDLVYEAIISKEQNNDIIINSLLGYVDARLCNQKTVFLVFKLFACGLVPAESLNDSFWYSNDFFNMCIVNDKRMYINHFKSTAYEPKNLFIDNDALINEIDELKNPELSLYLKTYLEHFELDTMQTKKELRNGRSYLASKFSHKDAEIIEFLCSSKKRNPLSIRFLNSEETLYVFENFGDVLNKKTTEYINSLSMVQLTKINPSHIRHIYHMLDNYLAADEDKIILALNIYLTLGYSRAIEFLNPDTSKSYGKINENIIRKMFMNINVSDVTFAQYGNGFLPIENIELINTIFGYNYKVEDTPIKMYLNKPEVTDINSFKSQRLLFKLNNINKFFEGNFAYAINNWNLIKEEYYRKQSISKLKSRLNINEINEIINNLTNVRTLLGPRDRYLVFSDVFKYAGKDNQYVGFNYHDVPRRVVELSRDMDGLREKYFPNINFTYGEYTVRTYNPEDRHILSAGYKSDCCFRALADADNDGAENSFLKYCCSTRAGGAIEILDKSGKILAFSPVIVSGNVLMIHSVESAKIDAELIKLVFKILTEYGQRVINATNKEINKIDYVCVTNATFYDGETPRERLKDDKRFIIYDPKHHYYGMYNNLNKDQYILASRNDEKQDNINYNQEPTTYEYPKLSMPYAHISFDKESYNLIKALENCSNLIIDLSNKRLKKNKNSQESYNLLQDIKYYRKEHLNFYQKLFSLYQYDIYSDYLTGKRLISEFANDVTINDFASVTDFYYSADWYITVSIDNKIKYEYSPDGKEECLSLVKELRKKIKESSHENGGRSRKIQ